MSIDDASPRDEVGHGSVAIFVVEVEMLWWLSSSCLPLQGRCHGVPLWGEDCFGTFLMRIVEASCSTTLLFLSTSW